jgi:hypothetical protein
MGSDNWGRRHVDGLPRASPSHPSVTFFQKKSDVSAETVHTAPSQQKMTSPRCTTIGPVLEDDDHKHSRTHATNKSLNLDQLHIARMACLNRRCIIGLSVRTLRRSIILGVNIYVFVFLDGMMG